MCYLIYNVTKLVATDSKSASLLWLFVCLFFATVVALLDYSKALSGTCWCVTICFFPPSENAHSWWCLAHSIHTEILFASFPPRQHVVIWFLVKKCSFGAADLPVNMGPWVPPHLSSFGVSWDNRFWKEMALLLGPVKIGGADAQQDRCSVLHTGGVYRGLQRLAYIHLCTWGDKWKNVTQTVQHHSRGRIVF